MMMKYGYMTRILFIAQIAMAYCTILQTNYFLIVQVLENKDLRAPY